MSAAGLPTPADYFGCDPGVNRRRHVEIKQARSEHAAAIVENLRDVNLHDLEFTASTALDILEDEIAKSIFAYVGMVDGRAVALWGVQSSGMVSGYGYLWLVTTKAADEHPFLFARRSKLFVDEISRSFKTLHGMVDPKFSRSIRWLRWLGFEVGEPEMIEKTKVRKFWRTS